MVEHELPCLLACSVGPAPHPLALEEFEEALCRGIVVAVAATADRVLERMMSAVYAFTCSAVRRHALGRTVLAGNLAGEALRDGELRHDMVDAATATGEA